MRVIAGQLGGRRLVAPRGDEIRPTSDRVREALFSILGDLSGARVLDLYCGTGALAIEAISRGAASATLVDLSVDAAARNVEALDLAERCRLERSDVVRFLRRESECYDLVFCDPPYGLAHRLGPGLDEPLLARIGEDGRVITETAAAETLELPSLTLLDDRSYGSTRIRIHTGSQDER